MSLQFNTGMSWWPLFISMTIFSFFLSMLNMVIYKNIINLIFSLLFILVMCTMWFKDMKKESLSGFYNLFMQSVFKIGMVMFIFTEMMFFFSFFWAYFHFMFMYNGEFGFMWPPVNIQTVNYMSIPLLNTLLLLSSSLSLTISHNFIMMNSLKLMKFYLMTAILLGFIFLTFQMYEYSMMSFTWHMSSYSAIFYMGTGFHGFHVLLGFSMMNFVFFYNLNINSSIFDMVAWYWHFVDMVWIVLFTEFYWWSY